MGENEREKSGVLDKMVRKEGFFEEVMFEQKPEVRHELLRCPGSRGTCAWEGLEAGQGS